MYKSNYVFDSYFRIRLAIGLLGILLPLLLIFGTIWLSGGEFLGSISAYYNSVFGPVFVGILFILALFLFAYKGSGGGQENIVTNVASVAAILTALLPCEQVTEIPQQFDHLLRPIYLRVLLVQ